MQLIRLKNKFNNLSKGKELGGTFEWEYLEDAPSHVRRWPHFTLFDFTQDYDWKEPASLKFDVTAAIYDLDDITENQVKKALRYVDTWPYLAYVVHTGGGIHIYCPFDYPLLAAQWKGHWPGYKLNCQKIEAAVGCKVDMQPGLQTIAYGRIPGSMNRKHGQVVKFLHCNEKEELLSPTKVYGYLSDDDSVLKKLNVRTIPPSVRANTEYWYKQCSYLQELRGRPDKIKHEEFLTVIRMLQNGGAFKVAREIFLPSKHADEVLSMLEASPVWVSCKQAATQRAKAALEYRLPSIESRANCQMCPYYKNGRGSIANITGKYPTPSAGTDYWTEVELKTKIKWVHESLEYVNGFVNKVMARDKDVVVVSSGADSARQYYYFDGRTYKAVPPGEGIRKSIGGGGTGTLKERLLTFAPGVLENMKVRDDVEKAFINFHGDMPVLDFNKFNQYPHRIPFQNCVYDAWEKRILEYNKDMRLVGQMSPYNYNENADISLAEDFFKHIFMEEDERELVQHFVGLSFTTLQSSVVRPALWIYGDTATGKTPLVNMIGEVVGSDAMAVFNAKDLDTHTKESSVSLNNIKVLLGDDLVCEKRRQMEAFRDFLTFILSGAPVKTRKSFGLEKVCRPYVTMFITSNSPPRKGDITEGLHRRLRMATALGRVERKQQDFIAGVMEGDTEMAEALILWAMRGLDKAVKRYKSSKGLKDYLPPYTMHEEQYAKDAEDEERIDRSGTALDDGGLGLFVETYIENDAKKLLTRGEIYPMYESMMLKHTGQKMKRTKFLTKFRMHLLRKSMCFKEKLYEGHWVFEGLGWKEGVK